MTTRLSTLYRYPLKSCAAQVLDMAQVEPRGLQHDRRWMIVDAGNRFVTGRQIGGITQITAHADAECVTLSAAGFGSIQARPLPDAPRLIVDVWKSLVHALPADAAADAWITAVLGQPARLVYMDQHAHRPVSESHGQPGDEVSFADGYPLLLISQASLDGLNARLAAPVPMLRFRPNLVVTDTAPHAEDSWRRIRVGEVEFDVVKPCVRCVFTTVQPDTGQRDPSGEPLRALLTYRRTPAGVTFGQNLIPRGTGVVCVGDAVTVLEHA